MRIAMTVFYLGLILVGVSFSALNARPIPLNLYVTTMTLPLSVLLILMLGVGIVLGCMVCLGRYWRLKTECHRLRGQLKLTEKEIKNLRAIPLHNQH